MDFQSIVVYFKDQSGATKPRLDLLMLTQGWRRFNWQESRNQSYKKPKTYPFSEGFELSGIATDLSKKPLAGKTLKITAKSKNNSRVYPTVTNSDGSFEINNMNQSDSITMEFSAFKNNGDSIDIQVILDESNKIKAPITQSFNRELIVNRENKEEKYLQLNKLQSETNSLFSLNEITLLNQVLLKEKKKKGNLFFLLIFLNYIVLLKVAFIN